jgi:hypothetical protein
MDLQGSITKLLNMTLEWIPSKLIKIGSMIKSINFEGTHQMDMATEFVMESHGPGSRSEAREGLRHKRLACARTDLASSDGRAEP